MNETKSEEQISLEKNYEEYVKRITPTHIAGSCGIAESQVAVFERSNGKPGSLLAGINHIAMNDQWNFTAHIGGKSGQLQGKWTLPVDTVPWKICEHSCEIHIIVRFHIMVITKMVKVAGV